MTIQDPRDIIIESLIKNLPLLANSLYSVLNLLQEIIENDSKSIDEKVNAVLSKLDTLAATLRVVVENVPFEGNIDEAGYKALRELYKESLFLSVSGVTKMIEWIRSDDKPDDILIESTDLLFKASQQTMLLVNSIVKEE